MDSSESSEEDASGEGKGDDKAMLEEKKEEEGKQDIDMEQ